MGFEVHIGSCCVYLTSSGCLDGIFVANCSVVDEQRMCVACKRVR